MFPTIIENAEDVKQPSFPKEISTNRYQHPLLSTAFVDKLVFTR